MPFEMRAILQRDDSKNPNFRNITEFQAFSTPLALQSFKNDFFLDLLYC